MRRHSWSAPLPQQPAGFLADPPRLVPDLPQRCLRPEGHATGPRQRPGSLRDGRTWPGLGYPGSAATAVAGDPGPLGPRGFLAGRQRAGSPRLGAAEGDRGRAGEGDPDRLRALPWAPFIRNTLRQLELRGA